MTKTRRSRGLAFWWALPVMLVLLTPVGVLAQEEPTESQEVPVKQIKMFAENWKWSPSLIRVTAGTKLSIEIENVDSPHSFEIKKLGIKEALAENETKTIEFLAAEPGTYRWRCARPCGNGCAKMTGKLIVEEPEEQNRKPGSSAVSLGARTVGREYPQPR